MSTNPNGVLLKVAGLGHIPALKNSMFSIVDKEKREWKRRCVQSFVSQLLSAMPTGAPETWTPDSQPFWTALLKQSAKFDDNWKVIREIGMSGHECAPGEEGAELHLVLSGEKTL